jgi:site-specific recombinase XerD
MATVTIQKRTREKGIRYLIYYKDPLSGKKKYYKTFQRLRDAQQVANDLRGLLDEGRLVEVSKAKQRLNMITFGDVADSLNMLWESRRKRSNLSEKTFEGYCYWLGALRKTFEKRLLCEISEKEIIDYRNSLASNVFNITSNRFLFVIKQVFAHGLELNAVKDNPSTKVAYLSEKEHERNQFLMPDQLKKLVDASQQMKAGTYLSAMIYLGAEHGASRQEILTLKWADIDFNFDGRGLIRFFRSKTKRQRTEYLMPQTRQALLEWREHQAWMRHRKKITDNGPGLVFCRLDGTPIQRFDKAWRKARRLAGFENIHFHDLRHTFCSNLLLSGSDLKDVKEMIGHRDLSMTDRYSHLTPIHKLSRQEKLAQFYSCGRGS